MSVFPGLRGQQQVDELYDYSGAITTGGTPQLLLPQRKSCTYLLIQNTSAESMTIQFGVQPATAVLTNGVVTSVTVNDAGFGFKAPPSIRFLGGGNSNDPATYGATMPDWPPPSHVAAGRAIMSAGAISSIEVDNGGSGYTAPPFVQITALRTDPTGVGIPAATAGIVLAAGATFQINGMTCPTIAASVYGGTTGQTFTCKFML